MEEMTLQAEALTRTQQNMLAYFKTHDVQYIAEDAVFKNLNTGEVHRGRAEIGAMLHYFYQVAFDARAEFTDNIITESRAMVEGFIIGKHIGDFMGIAATGKDIRVPICVSYDLKNSLIQEARIFLAGDVLMQQLGLMNAAPQQKTTFLVRDIFQLKFGHFREAKALLEEAMKSKMMPENIQSRVLTDFTGDAYRLIFEEGFEHLADYEISLSSSMHTEEWQNWYERFKPHVERSYREILKQVY